MRVPLVGWFLILIVLSLSNFTSVTAQSQQYPSDYLNENFLYQNWSIIDGLPVNSISSITQTSDGYLWMGTADGLVRFDGIRFEPYNTSTHPSLQYNRIKGVAAYKDSLFVTNSHANFFLFKDGVFLPLKSPEEITAHNLISLLQKGEQEIIIVTDKEQYRFINGRFLKLSPDEKVDTKLRRAGPFLWRAYSEELYWQGVKVINFGDQINEAIEDHEGSIWVATHSKGLYQVKQNLFTVYSEKEGLPGRNIYPVTEASDKTVWIGTHGNGIASLHNGEVTSGYLFEGHSSKSFVQSIIERKNGDLLVALLNGQLFRYSGEKIFMPFGSPLNSGFNCLFEDSQNRLWAGTGSGLYFFEDGEWKQINDSAINNTPVRDIQEAPDGTLWLGTGGVGLLHFNGAFFRTFNKEDGISSDNIRSLWIPNNQNEDDYVVWAGTEGEGLNRIKVQKGKAVPFKVTSLNSKNGLYGRIIHKIIPDDFGRVWMSSNRGIFWIYNYELEAFSKGDIERVTSTAYTERDGLNIREANGGVQPAGFKAWDGTLWFPTQDGVAQVNPAKIKRNEKIPPVYIESVSSTERIFQYIPDVIELEPGDRNLDIRFTALSFLSPDKVRFRYRLFNFDKEWTETSDQRTVRYTNLDPGEYTFKVIARNNDGVWNQQGDVLTVKVNPYFYEANWFYLLLTVMVFLQLLTAFLIIKKRANNKLETAELEISELQNQLDKTKGKLENQHSMKRAFLSNIQEALREPVLELKEKAELGREKLDQAVIRQTGELLTLIDQMLLMSKIEIEGLEITPTLEDLVKVAKCSIVRHKEQAQPLDPVIEFSSNTDKASIYLDKNCTEIIFRNLIDRCIHTEGVTKVRVQVIEESSMCTVKISDNGTAMDHQQLRTIFSLFNPLDKNSVNKKEIGIALPLVARLVELHKATIVVHSVPEHGNTFILAFKKGSLHFDLDYMEEPQKV